jgi:predicted transcriptional regulator
METLKTDAINAISSLPDNATVEDMMYRLYVIDKVHKGEQAIRDGRFISTDDLKKEIDSW